jgi:uncharacterized protein (TIGR02186 family)
MNRRFMVAMAGAFLLLAGVKAGAQEDVNILVDPPRVEVGLFYGGVEINVLTNVPSDLDVVVKISGMKSDLELKRKGRKAGVLWMNVGELDFHNVPALYAIESSRPLAELASKEELLRLGIGYESFKKEATAGDEVAEELYGELIELKEHEGLFKIDEGGVKSGSPNMEQVSASFFLPAKAPRGDYEVEVFGFENGRGSLLGSRPIEVVLTSSTSFISNMAENHGLAYGCLASAIAIIAGLITGYVFGDKGETH